MIKVEMTSLQIENSRWRDALKSTSNGFLYLVVFEDGISKVGLTRNLPQRLESVTRGRPVYKVFYTITAEVSSVEARVKRKLRKYCLQGEYFKCDYTEILELIDSKVLPLDTQISEERVIDFSAILPTLDNINKETVMTSNIINAMDLHGVDGMELLSEEEKTVVRGVWSERLKIALPPPKPYILPEGVPF